MAQFGTSAKGSFAIQKVSPVGTDCQVKFDLIVYTPIEQDFLAWCDLVKWLLTEKDYSKIPKKSVLNQTLASHLIVLIELLRFCILF